MLDAGAFRVYTEEAEVQRWEWEASVPIDSELHVDDYIWSELLADRHPDAPNVFYPFRVTRIRRVWIPERLLTRASAA